MEDDKLRGDLDKKYANAESQTRTEHLKERMYSREHEGFLPWRTRKKLAEDRPKVDTDWAHEKELPIDFTPQKRSPVGVALFLSASLIFLVVSGAFGLNYLRSSSALVSAGDIDLQITGPQTMLAGEVVELQIVAANRSETPLELADLIVTYPKGARSASDFTKNLVSDRLPLGKLAQRSVRRGTIRSVLLGKDGERQSVKFSLEYRVKGGNIVHSKEAEYGVVLTAGALTISIEANKEATSDQQTDLEATVTSHAVSTLHDVLLGVNYPFGFSLTESAPEPSATGVWELGDFYPGESRKVHIRGKMIGEEYDKRVFKFIAGTRVDEKKTAVETTLIAYEHMMTVKNPFLTTVLEINGQSPETFTFQPGVQAKGQVKWKNNLTTPISGATIAINLGGTALNKAGVKVSHGFYRSNDSLILWDAQTDRDQLAAIPPGKQGTLDFTIQTLPEEELQHVDNPSLTFDLHAAGRRINEKGVPENLQSTANHIAKVGTSVTLVAAGKYFTSPFPKRGPLPPRVEVGTYYAIAFDLKNTSNKVTGGQLTAVLPPNVRWTSLVLPNEESDAVSYNDRNRTVTWRVGNLISGTGIDGEPLRSVTFAVELSPSASQIGEEPVLIGGIEFKGADSFTGNEVKVSNPDINTRLTEDGFTDKFAAVSQQ